VNDAVYERTRISARCDVSPGVVKMRDAATMTLVIAATGVLLLM